ncbi:MAG: choice-of-anchor D domain-containing protein [Pirellulaceae bacterium]|nr:choice-of-anchor D domain-containing protein [Pirellulaceae bacterium]
MWHDLDADGIQDGGEPGVAGVTVTLIGGGADGVIGTGGDDTSVTTTTDANGLYGFQNLVPGVQYRVLFSLPVGYASFTAPDAGGNDAVDSDANPLTGASPIVVLASGQSNATIDAGLLQAAAIGDRVWRDLDGDGIQDVGEPGLPGVTVTLTGTNALGSPVNRTTTTDANGNYLFNGSTLLPGTYVVTVTNPGGYAFSPQDQGGNDAVDSDVNPATGSTGPVTVVSGQTNTTIDAGLYQPVSLGDRVWVDLNGNGIQNAGEPGLNGVEVRLRNSGGTVIATTVTANDGGGNPGYYQFSGLQPGTYSVQFVLSTGYAFSPQNADGQGVNGAVNSDADPVTGITPTITLVSGQNNTNLDAGFVPEDDVTIVGNDQDGVFTTVGEWYELVPCVGNFNNDVSYAPAGNGSSVGTWQFNGLAPGVYRVSVTWETLLGSPRATNAPFTVRGASGETPVTTRINQTLQPGDYPGAVYDQGFYWADIAGYFRLDGFTLFVDVSNNADNYVVADAVRIERVTGPEIAVSNGGIEVADNTGSIDFGATQLGSPITKTLTIQNVGGADLVLTGPITVPTGFTVVSPFGSTTLNPGQSTTFQVRYDAQSLGLVSGMLSFGTNDSDENPFNFTITAEAGGTIVDDGGPGFATSGAWTTFSTGGYGGDLRYASSGSGGSAATWTIGGLTPGQTYQIGATWMANSNRATNAAFQVYNGAVSPSNLVATTAVNQQLTPNDFTSVGVGWEQLAVVTASGTSITVRLDNNANGFVIADAVQARPIDAPQAVVSSDGNPITHNTGLIGFGVTAIGTDIVKTITVQNQGTQPLTLGTVSVNSAAFAVTQFSQTTLSPGQGTSFNVTMSANVEGTLTGTVTFNSNDPDENPFVFHLQGEVTGSSSGSLWIIDNGDAGYWTSCCWTNYTGIGFGGDLQYAASGNGSIVADWTFTGLTPGQAYELATTWTTHTNRATNAPYSLYNGAASVGNLVSSTTVNQQVAPNDFTDSGAAWERIGVITPTGSTVTVRLSNLANGYVVADAVRIQPTTAVAAPEITVSVDSSNLPDGSGSVTFGSTTTGTPVVKTFTVQNTGTANLILGAITMPAGFTASAFGTTSVAAGGSTTFTVTMTAGTAGSYSGTVSFVTNDADENPFDFAVSGTVNAPAAPEIAVSVDSSNLPDGSGSVAFGTTTAGTPVTKTFTVQNVGTADLTLGAISVPSGFTYTTFGTTPVVPGGSTTFTVTMTAGAAGSYSGTVSFVNNDADENPFNFTVSGTVTAPVSVVLIMDDGDPGYSRTGAWTYYTSLGYNADLDYTARGNGSRVATWSFTGLDNGDYLVSTTWAPHRNRATNAPYRIYNGAAVSGNLLSTVLVNQEATPSSFTDSGAAWGNLGIFTINGNTLTITLGNDANEYVVADAVRIERVSPLRAAGGLSSSVETSGLTQQQADWALAAAAAVWTSTGIAPSASQTLRSMPVQVLDLPGDMLGGATSVGVFLDANAAGYGWSVDLSALGATSVAVSDPRSGAFGLGGMDLLTVITHELGHVLGLDDLYGAEYADDLMSATLPPGVRRLPLGTGLPLLPGWSASASQRVASTDLLLGGLDPLAGFGWTSGLTSGEAADPVGKAQPKSDLDVAMALPVSLDDYRLPPDSKSRAALVESDDLDDLLDLLTDRAAQREPGSAAHDEIFADWDR